MGPETATVWHEAIGRDDLRSFMIQTPEAGWHKRTPVADPAWAFAARNLREMLAAIAREPFRRLHLFTNSPYGLGALLACELEYRFGRDREIHVYQRDAREKRWVEWGILGHPVPAGAAPQLHAELRGDPDATQVVVAINVLFQVQRAEVEPALQGLGSPVWLDIQGPRFLNSREEVDQLVADIDDLLRSKLPALFPQAEFHVCYPGPLAAFILGTAKLHLATRPLTIYDRIEHGGVFRYAPVLRLPQRRLCTGDGVIFLMVIDEWFSRRGGISTFNRELSRGLAQLGYRVLCCLTGPLTREEEEDAARQGIKLLLSPPAEAPDVIVGHDHITGDHALRLKQERYPRSRMALLVHTAPDEIEWYKDEDEQDDRARKAQEKSEAQARLAAQADLVFGIGPLLRDKIFDELRKRRLRHDHVHELRPWLLAVERADEEPPTRPSCLLVGRPEHVRLKGIDIAVRALEQLSSPGACLYLRGAAPGTSTDLHRKLQSCLGGKLRIQTFDSNEGRNADAFRGASVVLMPSRNEGFGLVGLEAISYSVPVLVTNESGLGEVLIQIGTEAARSAVVTLAGDDEMDIERWRQAIAAKLQRPRTAYQEARQLYEDVKDILSPTKILPPFVHLCLGPQDL
jgi:glycosyltransferase involved in cell wall biosynthesis